MKMKGYCRAVEGVGQSRPKCIWGQQGLTFNSDQPWYCNTTQIYLINFSFIENKHIDWKNKTQKLFYFISSY